MPIALPVLAVSARIAERSRRYPQGGRKKSVRNAAHGVVFRPASMKRMVQRVAISGAAALVLFATPAAARVRVFVGAG
ncbi:MAG TPA: hypothetical protein VFD84_10040, partial [Candidatus Binatia bacterium]|nr:hypothetical protein [Candidatus Binatia bacterium]